MAERDTSILTPSLRHELRPQLLVRNLTAGAIVGMLSVALTVSFVALVFSGELSEHLARAVGMGLMSSLLVGLAVAIYSPLPGAVASVRSIPAAILAAVVAPAVAALPPDTADAAAFPTAVAIVGLTTLLTAVGFLTLGSFRLGALARFLPYPVVGGFLAGTGWLLVAGAVTLMAGAPLALSSLGVLVRAGAWLTWLPGVVLGLVIFVVTRRSTHFLTWPLLLLGATALFFAALLASGATLDEWRARGLLLGPFPDAGLWRPLGPDELARVAWPVVIAQAASAATVMFISLIAVLLNATGLELIARKDADLNQELRAVGFGNLLAGFQGGMVGYPALSLSALNHRVGTGSRLASLAGVALVGVALLAGASFLAVIPTVIIGGLLVFLGLSFLVEWLYRALFVLPRLEYAIIVLILGVIAGAGFLAGVAVGLAAAVALFVVNYSRTDAVRHALSGRTVQSRVARNPRERELLDAQGERILILHLQGFIFFGTVSRLLAGVKRRLAHGREPSVRFVLLDFRRVTGLDGTALLSFKKLLQLAQERGVTLVLTSVPPVVMRHFSLGGLDPTEHPAFRVFADLDHGVEWCEDRLLAASDAGRGAPSLRARISGLVTDGRDVDRLLEWLERREVAADSLLLKQGEPSDDLYFIESGKVTALLEIPGQQPVRLESMGAGAVVGELGFFSGGVRTASVVADEACTVYRLTRVALARMTEGAPSAAVALHEVIIRLLGERVVHLMKIVDALQR